jgi:hypothetical protein
MLLRVRLYHVFFIAGLGSLLLGGVAHAATVVALGASNTFGKGVSRSQAYPAQLEALLRASRDQRRYQRRHDRRNAGSAGPGGSERNQCGNPATRRQRPKKARGRQHVPLFKAG